MKESAFHNVELRCAARNQYQADLDIRRDFMDARRGAGARLNIPRGMLREVR